MSQTDEKTKQVDHARWDKKDVKPFVFFEAIDIHVIALYMASHSSGRFYIDDDLDDLQGLGRDIGTMDELMSNEV